MMRMSRQPVKAESAASYYINEIGKENEIAEYYSEGLTVTGTWVGKGAAALGLVGDVTPEAFKLALEGINPRTGQIITEANTSNGIHTAGWDCAFSAPKSVSVQALVGGDRRLLEAHNRAVANTLPEIEHYAMVHSRHTSADQSGAQVELSENLVAAAFNHFAARPSSNGVPDPHIHTHVVMMNMTQRQSDSEWRALYTAELYRCQAIGTAIYLSELAHEVQKLGYGIQVLESYGRWELTGYTNDQVKGFSQRREDTLKYMAEHGLQGSIASPAGNIGRLNTRQPKDHTADSWTLEASWRARAAEYGIPLNKHLNEALMRGPSVPPVEPQRVQAAVEFSRNHATERDAVVDRRKLEKLALEHGMAKLQLNHVREQIGVEEKQGKLIRAGDSNNWSPPGYGDPSSGAHSWHPHGGAFTTDQMLKLESDNLEMVRVGMGKATPISDSHEAISWALHRGLLPDQITVAAGTLASNHRVTAIEGPAGSTKTYTVGAVRELAESKGYTVRGFGMTSKSVEVLRDAGIHAETIASLLHSQLPLPEGRELWFVDESSLLSTRYANQLLKAAGELGVARVIFVGDQYQHIGIEAGAPVKQFLRDHMAVFELTVIRRQKDPELNQAVEMARKQPVEALDLFEEQGRVTEIPEMDARYQRIALDYLRSHEQGHNTLVVSPGNDERRQLNKQIRKLLVEQGQVSANGREHAILVNRDLTKAQRQHAGSYRQADVIQFIKPARGIARGSYLQVAGVDRESNTLTLHGRDGAQVTFNPAGITCTQVYEWEERTIAVGDRLEFRANDRKNGISNHAIATIRKLDGPAATLEFDNGREMVAPLARLRHVDHGYAATSHAKQGSTVDNVILNLDTMRSDQLVNRQTFYVGGSRGALEAHIYTNDKEALRRAIARDPQKEIALDAVAVQIQQAQQVRPPQQQPQQPQSLGMRI